MADLEIVGKEERLIHWDEAEGLEYHCADGAARKDVARDKFCEDVCGGELVRDGTDHTDGDEEDQAHDEREDKSPDRELRREDLDGDNTEDE